jgi:hypothetical protein
MWLKCPLSRNVREQITAPVDRYYSSGSEPMTELKTIILLIVCMPWGLSCGGAPSPQTRTVGDAPPEVVETVTTESASPAVSNPTAAETSEISDIEEKKSLEIAQVEKLRADYLEMGFSSELAALLAETRIDFSVPDKFEKVEAVENNYWPYSFGLVARSGKVEVRIKVLPGENMGSAENGGNVSTANELMNVIIRLNGANLVSDIQDHPGSEASSRFNASQYTTGTFQPVEDFSSRPIASAGLIYKEGYGRIVVVTLMDSLDDEETRTEWITGANSIRFAETPDGE